MDTEPSAASTFERALSFASEACYTILLQHRRLRTVEPEDDVFLFRWWADLQFMIVALRRLRRAVELASSVSRIESELRQAIAEFDQSLPHITRMRNVEEHIDDYALDSSRRRYKGITRQNLQVGTWDGITFTWLDGKLNVDDARHAAEVLFERLRELKKVFCQKEG